MKKVKMNYQPTWHREMKYWIPVAGAVFAIKNFRPGSRQESPLHDAPCDASINLSDVRAMGNFFLKTGWALYQAVVCVTTGAYVMHTIRGLEKLSQ